MFDAAAQKTKSVGALLTATQDVAKFTTKALRDLGGSAGYQFAACDSFQHWQYSRAALDWVEKTSKHRR